MSQATKPRLVSAIRTSFYEPSGFSLALFVILCVTVFIAVIGLFIEELLLPAIAGPWAVCCSSRPRS